jgi:hypothetical protein
MAGESCGDVRVWSRKVSRRNRKIELEVLPHRGKNDFFLAGMTLLPTCNESRPGHVRSSGSPSLSPKKDTRHLSL